MGWIKKNLRAKNFISIANIFSSKKENLIKWGLTQCDLVTLMDSKATRVSVKNTITYWMD